MPPPIQQQGGSKAALITWTVITSILFVVATVLAIFAHVDRNKLTLEKESQKKLYDDVIGEADLNSDLKTRLVEIKSANPTAFPPDMKLINVALAQRDNLVRKIAGAAATGEADAITSADAAIVKAKAAGGDKLAVDSLTAAINGLATELGAKQQQLTAAEAAREAVNKKLQGLEANLQAQIKAKDEDLVKARTSVSTSESGVSSYRAEKDKQIQELQAKADETAKLAQDDMNKLQAQGQELQVQIKKLDQVIAGLQNRLRELRQPVDQVVRQADAKIMRLAGDGVVYIDLGSGDQVTPGMSFEVFDRLEGIPKPGDATTDVNLPIGKASIELIKVSPGSSEARIVRKSPGMTVVEGDLCVNIVYDKATKYNFLVYGNFDLDRNGQATPQDADVIKRLVTSWGGAVTDKLNVDVDFLVMGKVPVIPDYTAEELDTPEKAFELKRKQEELAAYDDILARAMALNIPVLNQNRFLYFTGYYEQSGR